MKEFDSLHKVRSKLASLADRLMFAGSAVLPWLVEQKKLAAAQSRSLDLVVSQVADELHYEILRSQLRESGFCPSTDSAMRWSDECTTFELFVTPYPRAGNYNRWHAPACEVHALIEGVLSVISAPYFLATELQKDTSVEPILQLVACRSDIVETLERADEPVRAYVSAKVRARLLDQAALDEQVREALLGFDDEQARRATTLSRLRAISELSDECDPVTLLSALLTSDQPEPAPKPIPLGAIAFAASASVRFADYDATQSVLTIGFSEDRTYRYFAVPKRVFDELCETESPGRFVNQMIRDRYPYEEI